MEEKMTVPDGLPTLSYGAHKPNSGQACVMELVSVLAGEQWSDGPSCTNMTLADYAVSVNDDMDDTHRRGLIEIAPLLISTVGRTQELDDELCVKLAYRYNSIFTKWRGENPGGYHVSRRFANECGIELLRELAQLCDEFNGYDRSAQEPQPVVETLTKIHERAVAL